MLIMSKGAKDLILGAMVCHATANLARAVYERYYLAPGESEVCLARA